MSDPLSKIERSAQMSKVRSKGNRSTESRVELALIEAGVQGWEKYHKEILGKPDFFFPQHQLALFVDGCFWHSCPVCKRRIPASRSEFWRKKIDENRRRDNRQRRKLRKEGYHVVRVWEHELKRDTWLKRLRSKLRRIEKESEFTE